jgi:hypothetical protein
LTLGDTVDAARLLLLAQLTAVIGDATASELCVFSVLPGGITAALKRTFWREATLSLQKEFLALSAA